MDVVGFTTSRDFSPLLPRPPSRRTRIVLALGLVFDTAAENPALDDEEDEDEEDEAHASDAGQGQVEAEDPPPGFNVKVFGLVAFAHAHDEDDLVPCFARSFSTACVCSSSKHCSTASSV